MIKASLKTLSNLQDQLLAIAKKHHELAVVCYPNTGFEIYDSTCLLARSCHTRIQHQIQIKMIETGIMAKQFELDSILARISDYEDYFLKANGDDVVDLQQFVTELHNEALEYKKSIHSLQHEISEFELPETILDELLALGINL